MVGTATGKSLSPTSHRTDVDNMRGKRLDTHIPFWETFSTRATMGSPLTTVPEMPESSCNLTSIVYGMRSCSRRSDVLFRVPMFSIASDTATPNWSRA